MDIRRTPKQYLNIEDRQVSKILIRIITIMMTTYVVLSAVGWFWRDMDLFFYCAAACVISGIPWLLLEHGYLRAGGFMVVLIGLLSVTILATVGQGIHDLAIMGFPVIIVIASLFMQRFDFLLTSLLTIIATGWLIFGESAGYYQPNPLPAPGPMDFVIVSSILLTAILTVSLLADSLRENMRQARRELGQREKVENELRYQSSHDVLTGMYNRAFFEKEMARLALEPSLPVSLVVADMDKLKDTNDSLGHAAGDEMLRRTAEVLRTVFRAGDVLARIGGDEFAIILPQTDALTSGQLLERIQTRLNEHNARHSDLPVRLSYGCATSEDGKLVETFVLADRRMYINKAAKRFASTTEELSA